MATYAEFVAAEKANNDIDEDAGPGLIGSFKRGVFQSPADVFAITPSGQRPDLTAIPESSPRTLETFREAPRQAETFRESLIRRSGIAEPTTSGERIAERVGRTAPFITAGSAGAFATGGFAGLATELAADLLASSVGESVAEGGGGAAAQMGAEILAGVFAPGVTAKNVAEGVAKQGSKRATRRMTRAQARRIAKKHDVGINDVLKTSAELKRRIDADPAGGERFIDEAATSLREGISLFPDDTIRPTSRQLLGERAGQNVSGLEESLAKDPLSPDFSAAVAGRKRAVIQDLEKKFDNFLPEGSADGARTAFDTARNRAKAAERAAWEAVPLDEMPNVSSRRLKAAGKKLREGPIASRKFLPDELNVIDEYGPEISVRELQAFRSELLDSIRRAKKFGADPKFGKQARHSVELLDAANKMIDELPKEGGELYLAARRLTAENADLFNPKSASVAALSELEDGRKIVSKIVNSKQPGSEARRAVRVVSQEDGGVDSLRRVFVDELFEQGFANTTPLSVLKKMHRHERAYREILGDEHFNELEGIMRRVKIARVGRAGTTAATASTGSAISPAGLLFAGAEVAVEPVQATTRTLFRRVTKDLSNNTARTALQREALLDPELFARLLELPEPRAVADWIVNWEKLKARASVRAAKSAGRSGVGPESERRQLTTPLPEPRR